MTATGAAQGSVRALGIKTPALETKPSELLPALDTEVPGPEIGALGSSEERGLEAPGSDSEVRGLPQSRTPKSTGQEARSPCPL